MLGVEARAALSTISVVGWEKFQHYKDRDPPWVKLYRDVLTTESWVLGTDQSRLLQIASILLAARYGNKIPFRWDLIKKVASLDMTEAQFKAAVQHLAQHNFLEIQEVPSAPIVVEQSASTALATCTSEAEAEKRQRRAEKNPPKPPEGAEAVFEHWKLTWGHPGASLDTKRRRRIEARLQKFTVAQVCDAITGFRNSPWHCGTDPKGNGTIYDGIDTLLRDDGQVERGLGLFAHPPRPPPKQETAMDRILRANGPDNSRVIEHDPEFRALTG